MSARHSPPSASITARSRSTTPGSCADRRSRVDAIAPDNARVSPTRSATPASNALPACPTRPVPSAVTVSFSTSPSRFTIWVILLRSQCECQQPALSLLSQTFPRPGQPGARRLTHDPGQRQRTGTSLPGTQTSPRTGLTPASRPELVAPLRHVDLLLFPHGAGAVSAHHAIAQASRPVPSRRKHKPQSVVGHSRVAARALSGVLPTRLKAVARWRFGHGMTGRPRAADWPVAGCRLARFRVPTDRSCRSAGYVEIARAVGPSRCVPPPRCLRAGARRQRDQLCESLVPPTRYRVGNLINGTIVYIDGRAAPMSYEHFPVLIGCLRSLSSLGSRAAQQGRRCALALSYECLGGSTRSQ